MSDALQQIIGFFASDGLLAILLTGLLVSVLINLAYVQRIAQEKKKKITPEQARNVIEKFIENQLLQTRNAQRHKRRKYIDKPVLGLRSAYLAIERAALDRGVDSEAYWRLLSIKLRDLLLIFEKHKAQKLTKEIKKKADAIRVLLEKTPNSDSAKMVSAALSKLEGACDAAAHDPDRLESINDKLGALLTKLNNEFYLDSAHVSEVHEKYFSQCEEPVGKIKENADSMHDMVTEFREGNPEVQEHTMQSLSDSTEALRDRIYELEKQLAESRKKMAVSSSALDRVESGEDIKNVNGELRDISEEIIAASEREIDRLNRLVKEKKQIISELEDALRETHMHEADVDKSGIETSLPAGMQQEVDLLRRNLLESEQCIVLLEQELDLLKTTRDKMRDKDEEFSEETVQHLNNTVELLKKEVMDYETAWREKDLLFSFIQEGMDATTAEDISLSIYQCLADMGFQAELMVNAPTRVLEINETGALKAKDKMLINSMQVDEINQSDGNRCIHFKMQNFGGAVRRKDKNKISAKESSNLMELFSLTQKMLQKTNSATANAKQKRSLGNVANSVKYLTKEMDDSFEEVIRNADSVVKEGMGQLQDVARSSGMSAAQIAKIKSLENNISEELRSNSRIKLRLHKNMLNLLQQIEKIDD